MTNSYEEIYALIIHLFTFQVQEGIKIDKNTNFQPLLESRQWVKDFYQNILKEFPDLNQPFNLRTDTPNLQRFGLLADRKKVQLFSSSINPKTNEPYRCILLYPQQIADSYALALDLYIPQAYKNDNINITDLKKFNPNHCLEIATDLGKTFFLTAFLPNYEPDKIEDTAQRCLQSLLNLPSPENCPPLYRKSQLLSSPIFEYGNPKETNTRFLILFFTQESSSEQLNKIYWQLPSLFLYYHKIIQAYHNSRQDYQEANTKIDEIEDILLELKLEQKSEINLSDEALEHLNINLKKLLKIGLEYSKLLRNLEYYQNTIAINTRNYQTKLDLIQQLSQDALNFFAYFIQKESPTLQAQINADLNYLKQGTIILEQAIATIRGLVEIDRAKSDRLKEEREKVRERDLQASILAKEEQEKARDHYLQNRDKERDRRLQVTILAVGTGVSAAGLFVSSYPLITAENPIVFPLQLNLPIHPFIKSISLGLFFGITVYFIVEIIARLINYIKGKHN